ncbi:MAG: SGNH/GDSL hydrolase family protein [Candidatus Krumholzibacteria bacterium]|nr:SGNH/GDSL hydrolase family protein [Candidatus Krumholzibacteria bacterium]
MNIVILIVTFCFAESIVRVFDYVFVDRPKGLIGLYYNHNSVISRRPTSTNYFGFNEDYDYTKEIPAGKSRIIFIGDSYTFGSGTSREKSYCEVVENHLNTNSNIEYEIFNAGVPGYSLFETNKMFHFLKNEGYQYDAIVLSIFLQNDLTDYIKRTYRKAACGFIQRFPQNIFLRHFHPLNSYIFRFGAVAFVYFKIQHIIKSEAEREQARADEPTDTNGEYRINPITYVRLERNYLRSANHDLDDMYAYISSIAEACDSPFYVVIIPDQFYGHEAVRQRVLQAVDANEYDFLVFYNWINDQLKEFVLLDVTEVIQNCSDCYIDNDMHLNDKGNKVLGEAVGKFLLDQE